MISRDWVDDLAVDEGIPIFVDVEADPFLYIPYCEVEGCTECPRSGVVRGIRWERVDTREDDTETPP